MSYLVLSIIWVENCVPCWSCFFSVLLYRFPYSFYLFYFILSQVCLYANKTISEHINFYHDFPKPRLNWKIILGLLDQSNLTDYQLNTSENNFANQSNFQKKIVFLIFKSGWLQHFISIMCNWDKNFDYFRDEIELNVSILICRQR